MLANSIKKGDTIGVVAPSEIITDDDLEQIESSKKFFEDLGYKIKFGKYVRTNSTGYGATPKEKAEDINSMFKDENIDAIICAEGGFNSNTTFDYLDYDAIKQNPKILCGYSDITSLSNVIYSKTGLVTFHGPNFKSISDYNGIDKYNAEELISRLQNKELNLKRDDDEFITIKEGTAEGKLIGGNLSLTTNLASGKYAIDFTDKILLIEELGFETNPSLASNYLYKMKQEGIFDKIKGIWVGNYEHESGITLEKILLNVLDDEFNFPIIKSNNFGHRERKITIPIGIKAKIDTNSEKKIILLEDCLR